MSICLRNSMIYSITLFWQFQEICRNFLYLWQLMFLCPIPDRIKVAAFVHSIEVNKCHRRFVFVGLKPNLSENSDIDRAH
jgi:hypothetical protein